MKSTTEKPIFQVPKGKSIGKRARYHMKVVEAVYNPNRWNIKITREGSLIVRPFDSTKLVSDV